ncbi:MAG: glycosyltransferase family 4 protein [Coriobacteriia bacterium]|nr:glycosyltransferase family 4 protein [Coriobacteriia bacterium]
MPSALFVTTVPITLEVFLRPFARRLRSNGWRVDALANGAPADPKVLKDFDAAYHVSWSRNPFDVRNLAAAGHVRRIVERGRYDLVHVHTPVASLVTRYALRRPAPQRPAVIYTAHGFHFLKGQNPLANAAFRTLERMAARWTDWLVVINDEDLAAAQRFKTISSERVRLVPGIGVDIEEYHPVSASERATAREHLGLSKTDFVLLMVAEFTANKRHALLMRALAEVSDLPVVALLAGEGPMLRRTERLAKRLGIASRVRFLGYRTDVPRLLAAADALVLVSKREGLSRSVLEALASGVPVIGTPTRGIADAVGEAGWIAPSDGVHDLAASIRAAASDPDEVRRRGTLGRERAVSRYALPLIIDEYERLYGEALSHRL